MKHFPKAICVLIILQWCQLVVAQTQYKFTHLTNMEGLSQSTVQAIVKDKYGFLWFGTQDGLNRYDGYQFKVYRHQPGDAKSLRKSNILSLLEDHAGNLWVGTTNGALSLYDRKHDAFIHYREATGGAEGLSQKSVTALCEDKENKLWVGTYWKLNQLDPATGKIVQYGNDPNDSTTISSDGITSIFEDSHRNLWVGTVNGLNIFNRATKKFTRFFHSNNPSSITDNSISTIFEDAKGRLWIGTNNGLNLWNPQSRSFRQYLCSSNSSEKCLGGPQITGLQNAGNGLLWIGTKDYLELFDPANTRFTHFGSDGNVNTTLNKNGSVTALLKDREDLLWVGTYQGGVNKYDPHLTYFETHRNNPQDYRSLSFNVVTSFAENKQGDIWIGTGGGGLNLWHRKQGLYERFNPIAGARDSLANWGVLSLYQGKRNDYLWIGTYGNCIERYDPKTRIFKHYTKGEKPDQLNNSAVYAVFEDCKGQVWMGTNGGGVNVLDQETGLITKYKNDPNNPNSLPGNFVRCFAEDRNGNIWVGTTNGISVFNRRSQTYTTYSQDNTNMESDAVFSICHDRRGAVWFGTLGGGLNKLDTVKKQVTVFTSKEGLPDNTINSIIEDNAGKLWLSTNGGLGVFDPVQKTVDKMGLDNGIQSSEFSQGAGLKTHEGRLLFGGINGYNVIYPEQLIKNDNLPRVVLSEFLLFNKPVVIGGNDSPLQDAITEAKEIQLRHDQSVITFKFVALAFTSPEKNRYEYKLEGFDKFWIAAGTDRSATYTNLNPGEYVFKVRAYNSDGLASKQITSIRVIITPPYWQRLWFRLLIIGLFLAAMVLLYQTRIKEIYRQKLLLEKLVRERTDSLAQINQREQKARRQAAEANIELERKNRELEQFAYVASHDMQEPLRTIASFVDLLQRQYKGQLDERADKYLTFVAQASDRMKVLVNDLLEYSRIGRKKEAATVDCKKVVSAVLADLGKMLQETQAEVTTGELPVIQAYPTEIKQVFQNLVVNAIKFRKKECPPKVLITAEEREDEWQFTVQDNGIGMDMKHSERIFVIFQRLHTRNEYAGSGIGLSHCKKIVELHKGRIWVESTPGEGSRFHFTINQVLHEAPTTAAEG